MPLLLWRNYLAASRKRNLLPFGGVRSTWPQFINVIEDYSGGGGGGSLGMLGFSGVQDGVNGTFTISSTPVLVVRNGMIQKEGLDFSRAGAQIVYVTPPLIDDILLFLG